MKRSANECDGFLEALNKRPSFLTLRPSQVPLFLHGSRFYQNLSIVEDDEFELSAICFKLDQKIISYYDLKLMLETIRFWGLDHIPQELVDFATSHDLHEHQSTLNNYEYELPYLKDLAHISSVRQNPDLMMMYAMKSGYVELVAGIKAFLPQWSQKHLETAIHHNHLHLLHYALQQGARFYVDVALLYWRAVQSGRVEGVKYLVREGHPLPARIAEKAVRKSQLEILHYLISQGCALHGAVHTAIECDSINCLRVLVKEGCIDLHQHCTYAAILATKSNSLSCLEYLHSIQHASFLRAEVSYQAARKGYLECLKYAHVNGSPWVEKDCVFAAVYYNHVSCLQYLVEQGCVLEPADDLVMVALRQGHHDIVKFLVGSGCAIPDGLGYELVEVGEDDVGGLLRDNSGSINVETVL